MYDFRAMRPLQDRVTVLPQHCDRTIQVDPFHQQVIDIKCRDSEQADPGPCKRIGKRGQHANGGKCNLTGNSKTAPASFTRTLDSEQAIDSSSIVRVIETKSPLVAHGGIAALRSSFTTA
jgi:hypothetical protein